MAHHFLLYIHLITFGVGLGSALKSSSTLAAVQPDATDVAARTDAALPLFEAERIQLTDQILVDLQNSDNSDVAMYAQLFGFQSDQAPTSTNRRRPRDCKTAPGDPLWPSDALWDVFNLLLDGALTQITPLASPCYPTSSYDNYNASHCTALTSSWGVPSTHYSDPGSIMFPLYEGKTCMPGSNASQLGMCTQGGYSSYSVNVSTVAQIQLAINFARNLDLRLVVKNTGHDYNGRSTGKDALSIWMHNLKEIGFEKEYISEGYRGPAFKLGAGVQVEELYRAAEEHGLSAVGGICPTVGVTGGYITGGGHSPLMQLFGMGADQVLALEVVTASGRFVTVTPSVNSDLYWAILGGGGGTFGIITSAIVKAHPKVPVTTSVFQFGVGPTVSEDAFWKAFAALWDLFPAWNAAKTYSYFFVSNITGTMQLSMNPFFAPNKTVAQYERLVAPLFANLTALKIPYTINTTFHTSFLPAYEATFGSADQRVGTAAALPGNRILPASNWNNASIRASTISALKQAISRGVGVNIYHQAPANPPHILNSVNPAFRTEASLVIAISKRTTSDDQLGAAARELTEDILGPLREVSPEGGAYGNEAEINEPDFARAFWGENYARLRRVKEEWDPEGVFYVHHGVGSEGWVVKDGVKWGGVPTQDGRLCRV